jgi:hypothetical protein
MSVARRVVARARRGRLWLHDCGPGKQQPSGGGPTRERLDCGSLRAKVEFLEAYVLQEDDYG